MFKNFSKIINSYVKNNPNKISVILILFLSLVYLAYINEDLVFSKFMSALNMLPYVITRFFIIFVVLIALILVIAEKHEIKDLDGILQIQELQLLVLYYVIKTVVKIMKKFFNEFILHIDKKYHFLLDAYILFILTGFLEYAYDDAKNTQIVLIIINVINITIGCYKFINKDVNVDNMYLSEYFLYLYIIISLIISK